MIDTITRAVKHSGPCLCLILLLAAGCRSTPARDGTAAEVHALTGAHTRVVWVQGDGTDPYAMDITAMLDLPTGQTLYPPERVALRYVVDEAGNPWRPSQDADVLLLGDSFTNIYSLATMGWGEGAGLAEQLSYVLQRPVDRIVQNDQGAHATRGLLHRELAAGTDRLAGKRVVIWQFAAREFAAGDWKVIGTP